MFYERFIQLCEINNEKPTNVLKSIGVSSGNLQNWKNGTSIKSDILMQLSEHFNVSTDYLLGRTNEKNLGTNYGIQNHSDNNQGDITNQLNLQGDNGLHGKMLGEFDKLDFKDQVKVLNLIAELSEKRGA